MKKTVYECDACGVSTNKPHSFKMKEFLVGCDWDGDVINYIRKRKIHLCDGCYKSLRVIVREKEVRNEKAH